ncbi:MAG: hypothetical protein ACTSRG_25145 [Candidatus Helarchaeota archaeon]
MQELLVILRHDLHKLKIKGYKLHNEALINKDMIMADCVSSWFSRPNSCKDFDKNNKLFLRKSYFLRYDKIQLENNINQTKDELFKLFNEKTPEKLHKKVLKSKILNFFCEARSFPYTSYKYHLLLTGSIYWNLLHNYRWQDLYLCENEKVESQFQIIYKDSDREWALSPTKGMSRVSPKFSITWNRRIKQSIGGENRPLDGLLSQIQSWSTALATIEDWNSIR